MNILIKALEISWPMLLALPVYIILDWFFFRKHFRAPKTDQEFWIYYSVRCFAEVFMFYLGVAFTLKALGVE